MRFILQPMLAILSGMRGGMADARAGNPPYLFGLLFHTGRRRELMQSGVAAISTLLAMGIILDIKQRGFPEGKGGWNRIDSTGTS